MKRIAKYGWLMGVAVMAAACSSDVSTEPVPVEKEASGNEKMLTLGSVVIESRTRSITENFTDGDVIGLFVYDAERKLYNDDCANIACKFADGKFYIGSQIPIEDGRTLMVAAYFPYSPDYQAGGFSDGTVDIPSTNGDLDLLITNATFPDEMGVVQLQFRHAIDAITFEVAKGQDYVGEGKLTSVIVESAGVQMYENGEWIDSTSSALYLPTGICYCAPLTYSEFLCSTKYADSITYEYNSVLTDNYSDNSITHLFNSPGTQDLVRSFATISVVVDDKVIPVKSNWPIPWLSWSKYTYRILINTHPETGETYITVSGNSTIESWEDGGSEDL